jgi:hypothetical protein
MKIVISEQLKKILSVPFDKENFSVDLDAYLVLLEAC